MAEDDAVIVEHSEEWRWHGRVRAAAVRLRARGAGDGVVTRWRDYWDLQTLMNAAAPPGWWVEHIVQGY